MMVGGTRGTGKEYREKKEDGSILEEAIERRVDRLD